MAWNLHAIEQTQSQGRRRVDGVGRLRFDFHTASNSRWCRFFSSIFSYLSFRLPPAMVAAMVARARLPPRLPAPTRFRYTASGSRPSARSGATISRAVGEAQPGPRPQPSSKMRSAVRYKVAASGLPTSEPARSAPFCFVTTVPRSAWEPSGRSRRGKSGQRDSRDGLLQHRGAPSCCTRRQIAIVALNPPQRCLGRCDDDGGERWCCFPSL